jgi:monovalent cation:H+ antiporter-2, CPA2 family
MEHAVHSLIPVMIVLLAGIVGAATAKALRLTPILGFFIAGVVIGPSALGLVHQNELMTLLAEIGVVLLLFDIGLHLSFRQMWRLRRDLFVMGPLQVLAAGVVIGGGAYYLGLSWQAAIIVGAGLALSSTAIVMQLLHEKKQSNNPLGQTATSILVFQDILIVFLLVLVPALGGQSDVSLPQAMGMAIVKAVGALIAVYGVGKYILQPLLARIIGFAQEDLFTASILLIIIATASFTGYAGLSLPLGAFLAGLIISETTFCYMVKAEIAPFRTLLLGLFFITVGMTLNAEFLVNNWLPILGIVAAIMMVKVATLLPVAMLQKRSATTSVQLGLWLSQAGEFGFVLFALAFAQGLLTENIYQMLMVSIGVSFVLTPLMITLSDKIGARSDCSQPDVYDAQGKVIILGFGAEGKNVARLLHSAGIDYLGIDPDVMRISTAKSQGFNAALGDPAKPSLYTSIHTTSAKAAIFALDNDGNLPTHIKRLKQRFPDTEVFANLLQDKSKSSLKNLDVTHMVHDTHQNGIAISRAALLFLGKSPEETEKLINNLMASS